MFCGHFRLKTPKGYSLKNSAQAKPARVLKGLAVLTQCFSSDAVTDSQPTYKAQ